MNFNDIKLYPISEKISNSLEKVLDEYTDSNVDLNDLELVVMKSSAVKCIEMIYLAKVKKNECLD